jgi:hypothetical protein
MIPEITQGANENIVGSPSGWYLFSPNDVFETNDLDIFEHFLNSKGTVEVELANFKVKTFTLVARGRIEEGSEEGTACVLFHSDLNKMSRPRKINLAENIYALPGVGSIAKNRLGNTLAEYFGVTKQVTR